MLTCALTDWTGPPAWEPWTVARTTEVVWPGQGGAGVPVRGGYRPIGYSKMALAWVGGGVPLTLDFGTWTAAAAAESSPLPR